MVLLAQVAVTPVGNPVATPIPFAPTVVCVIAGVNDVLTHKVGVAEGVETELIVIIVIVPVALIVPHPPVNGIV